MRYISHEIRTPLNSAFLGLKLLLDDLRHSKNQKNIERYDTLSDVNTSCSTAIDILNDLLCFEKLESGILQLHKTDEAVLPFMSGCVKMFAAQVRECEVNLQLVVNHEADADADEMVVASEYHFRHAVSQNSTHRKVANRLRNVLALGIPNPKMQTIRPSDVVKIDKFKMDQVVRNLISNALKFTPRGSNVIVKAGFVEIEDQPFSERLAVSQSRLMLPAGVKRWLSRHGGDGDRGDASNKVEGENPESSNIIRGRLVITVADEGAGISPENQQRLFTEIVQFSPEKLQGGGGSGFGLFITKGIVDLHGGTISVFSKGEGHGCTFTVTLPMERDESIVWEKEIDVPLNDRQRTTQQRNTSGNIMSYDLGNTFSHEVSGGLNIHHNILANGNHRDPVQVSRSTKLPRRPRPQKKKSSMLRAVSAQDMAFLRGGVGGASSGSAAIPSSLVCQEVLHNPGIMSYSRKDRKIVNIGIAGGGAGSSDIEKDANKYHLLVVDDSHLNRKMLSKILKAVGHTCEEADNGNVAVEQVKKIMCGEEQNGVERTEYDCILMDFNMPVLDGPSAASEMRSLGYKGRIVGLTGNGLQSDIDKYLSHGANQVFVKPIDMDAFQSYMSKAVV